MKTNYRAGIVSAILCWILGAVWYDLLFGKPWMALENMTEAQVRSMNPVLPFVVTFLLNVLIA
ncbi:MAG TPA: DUF1761 domain-containing protein [Terriglobia bacterium]|nr:DUF1761 domain-containing protein [Terriglobia bacterium]